MSRATLLPKLFDSLAGTWTLRRCLVSANASEPSGTCTGTALFTPRPPSPVVNTDGRLDLADNEMLYHEQGTFELPSGVKMPFTKKYIWRLQKHVNRSNLSVWFCKPGTEIIDYVFHTIDIDTESEVADGVIRDPALIELGGNGGHLCIDDFYSTTYTFRMDSGHHTATSEERFHKLHSFSTVHEVRGPRKDQVISTSFTCPLESPIDC